MSSGNFKFHLLGTSSSAAELINTEFTIRETQDALDLIAEAGEKEITNLIIASGNLDKKFFDLKSGLAGEVLQKFSNYRMKLAITGDFSAVKSKSLRDFIRECNRGNQIFFCNDLETALEKLEKNQPR